MNLVETILDQVSGDSLGKLSSLLNTDGKTTRTAVSAAVPAMLAGLASVASNRDGAQKMAGALGNLDLSSLGGLGSTHSSDTGSLLQKGGGLLASLFGDNLTSNLAGVVGRFAGLTADNAKKLLAALLPTVLGPIASQWKNRGGTPDSLANLLAEQKENIYEALPSGLSLASIPGLTTAESAVRHTEDTIRMTGDTARRTAGVAHNATESSLQWLLPVGALALAALGLWWFLGSRDVKQAATTAPSADRKTLVDDVGSTAIPHTTLRPEMPSGVTTPNLATMTSDLKSVFNGALGELANVRDAASAEIALPKLKSINAKLDTIRGSLDSLPEAAQTSLGNLVGEQMMAFKEQAAKTLAIPGVGDRLRPVVDEISAKLAGLNLAEVSKNTTSIIASLTRTIQGIKDRATAQEAVPQLEQISQRIDELKQVQTSMSAGGQAMLAKQVTASRTKLEEMISGTLAQLGGDASSIKTVFNAVLDKLASLGNTTTRL